MRRFLTLVCLIGLALPAGISISGCTRNPAGNYCNGLGYGKKNTEVANITLQPQVAGISLAYGQTTQAQSPTATTCEAQPATINSSTLSYGTTNNQLVDISPGGNICAGTWNRNSGGGIADYTICNYPNPLPATNGLPYSIAYITATADAVTSNPVEVYIHAPISSISLVTTPLPGAPAQGCYSQNQQATLDADAFYTVNGAQTLLCAPGSATLPSCSNSIGTLNFAVGTGSVASINASTNVITAQLPGTTAITATIAQSSSAVGYFSTCPPASISIALANGGTQGVVTQGVQQNLTTSVIDTQGHSITGLSLDYQSTNPIDINAAGAGSISAIFPGVASVNAICAPSICDPAPINELGLNGTGLSITSNPVSIVVPGTTSNFAWFSAPGQSQYFASIQLLTGTPGSTVRLPYVPNSMLMDQTGSSLYFGSAHELMIYSTIGNSLAKQDTSAPGVVLAVAPNNSQILINDQARHLFYLYNASGGSSISFGGMGSAAAWTADAQTLYITDNANFNTPSSCGTPFITGHTDTLYVYNANSGWSTYPLPPSPLPASALPTCSTQPNTASTAPLQTPAITVPGVGAYMRGNPTVAHTWCPTGTVGNNASISYYPQPPTDTEPVQSDVLTSTTDGRHILSAVLTGASISLDDIGVTIPTTECPEATTGTPPNQVQTMSSLSTHPTINATVNLTTATTAVVVNQVVAGTAPSTASTTTAAPIAFVTYSAPAGSTTAAKLPYYLPATTGVGQTGSITLAGSTSATPPTAPLAGAFSPDNSLFFVSTQGDNQVHFISIPANVSTAAPPTDTQQVSPNLPACTPISAGGVDAGCLYPTAPSPTAVVPTTAIAVKPRSVT